MVVFDLLSALFDLLLIGLLLAVRPGQVVPFRTAWFIESACSEMLVSFAIRSRVPWLRSRPGPWLLGSSAAAVVVAFVDPPGEILALVGAALATYFAAAELLKRPFFRHFDR